MNTTQHNTTHHGFRKLILLFPLLLLMLNFNSCRKAEEDNLLIENNPISKSASSQNIKCWNGMLHFANMEDVRSTLKQLETAERYRFDEVRNHFITLNLDDFDAYADSIGLIDDETLVNFENQFSCYKSLRKDIVEREAIWLQNEELDENTDPDNHYIDNDYIRSILNTKSTLRIGDSVYVHGQFCNSAYHYLEYTGNEPECIEPRSGVVCKSQRRNQKYFFSPTNNKRRAKMVVSHWTYVWDRYATAKVKNYKKVGCCWHLTHYEGLSFARVYGFVSDNPGDCSKQLNFNSNYWYSAGDYQKKVIHSITVQTLTSSGWIKGRIRGINGSYEERVLTFNN